MPQEDSALLTIFQSVMYQLNSTVVETEDAVLVFDPGYAPQEVEQIRAFVETRRADRPVYLIFTHSDFDHIVGYGAFENVMTIGSRNMAERTVEDKIRILTTTLNYDEEFYFVRPYTLQYPLLDHVFGGEGETLQIGGTRLTFYQGEGHNPDGVITLIEPSGILVAGDYLSDIEFPFVFHSLEKYKGTLEKFVDLAESGKVETLVPGHGSLTKDMLEMKDRIAVSSAYLKLVQDEAENAEIQGIDTFLHEHYAHLHTVLKTRHAENVQAYKKEANL
jgi:hydroxyacylglutathione hydrolase